MCQLAAMFYFYLDLDKRKIKLPQILNRDRKIANVISPSVNEHKVKKFNRITRPLILISTVVYHFLCYTTRNVILPPKQPGGLSVEWVSVDDTPDHYQYDQHKRCNQGPRSLTSGDHLLKGPEETISKGRSIAKETLSPV